MNVVDDFAEIVTLPPPGVADCTKVALDEDCFVASAEEMAPEPVAGVDAARERVLKPCHALDEVGLRRFEDPVVVVVHEDPCGATLA